MRFFDTHMHLSDEKYNDNRQDVIENFRRVGVELGIEVTCDLDNIGIAPELARDNVEIYSAYGMHPHYVSRMTNAHLDTLAQRLNSDKCVALGEIGLDYHYDFSPREEQCKWFSSQLELAQDMGKPVILHIREAFGDCMDILRSHSNSGINGVMHCYSGSYESAKLCLDMGMYIAFGGSITFGNAHNLREVAGRLPLDRLLIETDCPYMTPVPHRGKTNEPAYVPLVAEMLAQLHNVTVEQVAETTFRNGKALFDI